MLDILGKSDLLIKEAKIIDPAKNKGYGGDIYIKGGKIEKIGKDLKKEDATLRIDAKGYTVFPGFTDMHVHLREPGEEKKEDIKSGVKAALRGGITSIACMPNTKPPVDSPALVKFVLSEAEKCGFNVYPVAAMTKGLEGTGIAEIGLLKEAGAIAFSDDGKCVADSRLMLEIMRYAKSFGCLLILHEEDYSFSGGALANEGYPSIGLGLEGFSSLAEEIVVARDIQLSKKTKAKIHVTHVSSRGSVEMIRQAKKEGVPVTCDVTPHHIYFNDHALSDYNTNLKVNPPIRGTGDQEAIIEGIKDGTIDAIASDHAPHLKEEKNTTFREASFGAIGMETLFKATYTKLCKERGIPLKEYIKLLTIRPAKILGIDTASIAEGKIADMAIVDTETRGKLEQYFYSKSSNCPFTGEELYGEIIFTINKGRICFVNSDAYGK
ncbi:MAG: dihydroorotase [Actinomycetota bacterium]